MTASADALASFGPRVRQARLELGMSARALAEQLGISPSAVSQIESGKIRPTMKRLHDLVRVLGIDLDEVFSAGDEAPVSTTRGDDARPAATVDALVVHGISVAAPEEHPRLVLEDGVEWLRISPIPLGNLEVLRSVYPPGARTSDAAEFIQHGGWEMGYLLSGRMQVQVAFETHVVEPGASICFDSSIPHKLSNPYQEPAVALWIRGTTPGPRPQLP